MLEDILSGTARRAVMLFLHIVQDLGQLITVRLVLGHQQVGAPVARVEAPVTGAILQFAVHMTHEALRREQPSALGALDTPRLLLRVQFGEAHPLALAEALVMHAEVQRALGRALQALCMMQQRAAQPFRVRLGDQAAGRRVLGQDARHLQLRELLGCASRAVDLQLVADAIDLVQREVRQHTGEDLRQTEALLAAHHETGDGLALQERLGALSTDRVGGREDGLRLLGRREGRRGRLLQL